MRVLVIACTYVCAYDCVRVCVLVIECICVCVWDCVRVCMLLIECMCVLSEFIATNAVYLSDISISYL